MSAMSTGQYATDANLRARQRLWAHLEPAFDVADWTLDLADVRKSDRVLDVGCGNGRYLAALQDRGAYPVGCDLSIGILRSARHPRLVAADAVALPFPTGSFDTVLAPHMLYHVPDRASAIRELRRVLVPGGCCIAVTNGDAHLASLRAIVTDAAASLGSSWQWRGTTGGAFSMENGAAQLAGAFEQVRTLRLEPPGRAIVTDPDVISDYVASVGDIHGRGFGDRWPDLVAAVRNAAAATIDRDGAFIVENDVGAFICR